MNETEYEEIIKKLKNKIYDLQRTISDLRSELQKEQFLREQSEYRIKTELEPRLKQEARSYDAYVTTDWALEASEDFGCKVDDLVEFIEKYPDTYFEWGDPKGNLYERILYTITHNEE